MTEQRIDSDVKVNGVYRLYDATPEPDWSNEDKLKWYKKNVAAGIILAVSLLGLVFLSDNKNFQVLSIALAGSASSILLNGENNKPKAK